MRRLLILLAMATLFCDVAMASSFRLTIVYSANNNAEARACPS